MGIENNPKKDMENLSDTQKSREINNNELTDGVPELPLNGDIDSNDRPQQKAEDYESSDDTTVKGSLQRDIAKSIGDSADNDKTTEVNDNPENTNSSRNGVKNYYQNATVQNNNHHTSRDLQTHVNGLCFVITQIDNEAITKVTNENVITIWYDTDDYVIKVICRQVDDKEQFFYKIEETDRELTFRDLNYWLMEVLK